MSKPAKEYLLGWNCPITAGQTTRMLEGSFARICAVKRAQAASPLRGYGIRFTNLRCLKCAGDRKHWPPELEIIEMANKFIGEKKCPYCGKVKQILRSFDREMCAACGQVFSAATNRPDDVWRILAEANPDWFAERLTRRGEAEEAATAPSQEDLDRAEAWWAICRALEVDIDTVGPMDIARDVAQTAAMLEQEITEVRIASGLRRYICETIGVPANSEPECIVAAIDDLKSRATTGGDVGDKEHIPFPLQQVDAGSSTVDTYLLDLALAIMRGEVTGIEADWISMMREALGEA
ncbi:MAG: hypothetical protein ACOX5Z_00120 [Desulfobulbus sp.]|jgi:hypothetical protein